MSHVAEGVCRINDLDTLETAAAEFGMELVRGKKTYRWYGRFLNDWSDKNRAAALKGADASTFGQCDHVLRFKNANSSDYEIGVKAAPDGNGFRLEYDSYGPGHKIEQAVGADCAKLADEYNAQVAMRSLARQGMRVRRTVNAETGELQVIAVKA